MFYKPHGSQIFTESGTFIVPNNVTILKVCCIGGGGAGGSYQYLIAGSGGTTSFGSYITAPGGAGGKGGGDSSYSGYAGSSGGDCSYSYSYVSFWRNYAGSSYSYGSNGATPGKLWDWDTSTWTDSTYGTSGYGVNARDGSGASGSSCAAILDNIIPGSSIPVTIGTGGSKIGSSGRTGTAGNAGVCIVYW